MRYPRPFCQLGSAHSTETQVTGQTRLVQGSQGVRTRTAPPDFFKPGEVLKDARPTHESLPPARRGASLLLCPYDPVSRFAISAPQRLPFVRAAPPPGSRGTPGPGAPRRCPPQAAREGRPGRRGGRLRGLPSGRRPVRRRGGGGPSAGRAAARPAPRRRGPLRAVRAGAGPGRKVRGRGRLPRPVAGLFSGCQAVSASPSPTEPESLPASGTR